MAQSEFILLLDDDIELQPDLIEKHLYNLARFQTNVSNGVLKEKDLGELPEDFRFAS